MDEAEKARRKAIGGIHFLAGSILYRLLTRSNRIWEDAPTSIMRIKSLSRTALGEAGLGKWSEWLDVMLFRLNRARYTELSLESNRIEASDILMRLQCLSGMPLGKDNAVSGIGLKPMCSHSVYGLGCWREMDLDELGGPEFVKRKWCVLDNGLFLCKSRTNAVSVFGWHEGARRMMLDSCPYT